MQIEVATHGYNPEHMQKGHEHLFLPHPQDTPQQEVVRAPCCFAFIHVDGDTSSRRFGAIGSPAEAVAGATGLQHLVSQHGNLVGRWLLHYIYIYIYSPLRVYQLQQIRLLWESIKQQRFEGKEWKED